MTVQQFPDSRTLQTILQKHWRALLIEGCLLIALGLAAILVPSLASLAVTIFLGWLFLVGGLVELALLFWARQTPGFWWSLVSALLAIGAGVVLIARPVHCRDCPGSYARATERESIPLWGVAYGPNSALHPCLCSSCLRWNRFRGKHN